MSNEAAYKRIALIFPMLSSSNEGEVLNAARAMNKVLKDNELHWNDVAGRIREPVPQPPPRNGSSFNKPPPKDDGYGNKPRREKSNWAIDKEDVERAHAKLHMIGDDWSEEFLESIHDQVVHQGRSLSDKQRAKLNEILDKLGI